MLWLSEGQVGIIPLATLFVFMYIVAYLAGQNKSLKICLLACVISQMFSLSPLHTHIQDNYPNSAIFFIYFAIYAAASSYFIYTIVTNIQENIGNYKPAATCLIMALFEIISYETFYSEFSFEGFENVLYDYYEIIVTLLHLVIISSVVRWSEFRSFVGRFCNLISGVFLDRCWFLLNRRQTRYNKERRINREN